MNARAMLEQAVAENASDIFLVAGRPLSLRKNGVPVSYTHLTLPTTPYV